MLSAYMSNQFFDICSPESSFSSVRKAIVHVLELDPHTLIYYIPELLALLQRLEEIRPRLVHLAAQILQWIKHYDTGTTAQSAFGDLLRSQMPMLDRFIKAQDLHRYYIFLLQKCFGEIVSEHSI